MSRSELEPSLIRIFAYGSNMCLPHLSEWAAAAGLAEPAIIDARSASLANFRLAWNYRSIRNGGGRANIVREKGNVVHGVLLTTDEIGLETIDCKEGTPLYYSRSIEKICVAGAITDAWVYQVTDRWLLPPPVWPNKRYLDLIISGARAHDLPDDYVSALASVPVIEAA